MMYCMSWPPTLCPVYRSSPAPNPRAQPPHPASSAKPWDREWHRERQTHTEGERERDARRLQHAAGGARTLKAGRGVDFADFVLLHVKQHVHACPQRVCGRARVRVRMCVCVCVCAQASTCASVCVCPHARMYNACGGWERACTPAMSSPQICAVRRTCTHTHTYMLYAHTHMGTHTHTHMCMHTHTQTYTHTCVHIRTHSCACTYAHPHVYAHTHTHTHTYTYTYTYTHTYTHTHTSE